MANANSSDPGQQQPPAPPTDEQVVQSLIGTESKGQDVVDLVNKLVGDNAFSNRDRGTGSADR